MAQYTCRRKASLVFNVTRRAPELIPPAGPTPYEFKELSDVDDQEGLRFQVPMVQFYRKDEHFGRGRDPARVLKEAVAKALVLYYPLAGRLREKQGRKLVVECNGQGIMFIEADADVTLDHFGDALQPPFPCFQELLYDVPGSTHILASPLLLIQVTRLKCDGFILAIRFNHTIVDAVGLYLFMNTLAELARGAHIPSMRPVWERHLLSARNPPRVTCEHPEYEEVADPKGTIIPMDKMVHKSFFFGPKEIATLRRFILPNQKASTFEIISAWIWRCRTIALRPDPEEIVRFMCVVNSRPRFNPPLPSGYYGNGLAYPVAFSTASKLWGNPIGYALDLIHKAKDSVTQEFMMSLADFMVLNGRPHFTVVRTFILSDLTRAGWENVDYGWGKPVYSGPAIGGVGAIPGTSSYCIPYKNWKGEKGIVVPLCLPKDAMDNFVKEINGLFADVSEHPVVSGSGSSSSALNSSL